MDKLAKEEMFKKLTAILSELTEKTNLSRTAILKSSLTNDEFEKWESKFRDLVSGGRGLNNAEFFYDKIQKAYSRISELSEIKPVDSAEITLLREINRKLDENKMLLEGIIKKNSI